jgi:isopentenyl-diphosphate Delta-isomerase
MHSPSQPLSAPAQRDDEWFDVVNERDEVVGRATRREVHARGLWHRAVQIAVLDGNGRVFLQKRSLAKDTAPGCWDGACSGHVDSGETYATAAVRELREEIGLIVPGPEALTPLFQLKPSDATGWEFIWVYRLISLGPFVPNPAEIERVAWFDLDEVTKGIAARPQDYTGTLRALWPRLVGGS